MITGDRNFKPGNQRYDLQRAQVEELASIYWGWGHLFFKLPKGRFDVITAQDPLLRGAFARRVAKKTGARLNLQIHTDLSALPWLKRRWAMFNLRKADSVRVVSEKIKQQVEDIGIKAPTHVLPIYIDVEKFRSIECKPHAQKTILWLGRFEPEKDPLCALLVLQKVREVGIDARLVLLGTGSLEKFLRAETVRLSLTDHVKFPGWKSDTAPYLAVADVVLCTSKHESWGASIVEALAAGVPVVAPDIGIAREAGAIVVPKDKIAEAVIDVLKSNKKGELKLKLPTAEEWAKAWTQSLI